MLTLCIRGTNVTAVALVARIYAPGREQILMGRVEVDASELVAIGLSGNRSEHIICELKM